MVRLEKDRAETPHLDDGLNPMPPMFCYLKPYYNDPNKSYFEQLAEGTL